jgi:diacylglycerol kinase (ATP)
MRTAALVTNPGSGTGAAEEVAECLRGLGVDVEEYTLDQAEAAVRSRAEGLVVAGGDGSLAGVAASAAAAGVPVAVIPTGTANDFARELGIPRETEEACGLAARGSRTRSLDIGRMGDRPFLNVASLGLPPAAAEHAVGLKRFLGPLAYAVGAVRAGLTASPVSCRVVCDGEEIHDGDAWQVTVACTGAFGGGSSIETDLADRKLDVVVIQAASRLRLAHHAYGLRRGGIGDQPGVTKVRCARAEVQHSGTESWNVDGELVESRGDVFTVDPSAVQVIVG